MDDIGSTFMVIWGFGNQENFAQNCEIETSSALLVPLHLLHPPYYLRETDIISSSSSRLHFVGVIAGRPLSWSSSSSFVLLFPGPRVSSLFISLVVLHLPGHRPVHRPRPASRLLPVHLADSLVGIGHWSPHLPSRWSAPLVPGRRRCSLVGKKKCELPEEVGNFAVIDWKLGTDDPIDLDAFELQSVDAQLDETSKGKDDELEESFT
ncbi:hypothetical protein Syun_012065 [Stephania yunnanensis]|uniref:Uncharacterized protein n=1 Tax=Stephania yunnanensis TaxID=152371 RepID=A0AAP0K105_9MAGN